MIYLKNITDAQVAMIPKNGESATGALSLIMKSTVDLEGPTMEAVDLDTSDLYFNLSVALPGGLASGEYQYQLMDGEILVSCGICYIGDLEEPSQYESTITYKEYDSEQ